MAESVTKKYRPWEPDEHAIQAYSPAERLPEGDLVFFLIEAIPLLDLSSFYASYELETRGAPPFDPALMVTLLVYAYCVGVYSSRKIARACERNLAFLAIVGDKRPDFRTISDFRKEHLGAFPNLFGKVLALAAELGMVGLGNIAFDGSKFKADASRHKAMSYGYMKKEKARLKAEIEALLQQASTIDTEEDAALGARRGDELPEELQRREQRLATITGAMARLEAQAKADAEAERQRRAEAEAQRQRTNTKRRGKEPGPVRDVPEDTAQISFTDPEAKMMLQSNKGWDYSGNAQVSVDEKHQIIVAAFVTAAANDARQAVPLAQATRENLAVAGVALPMDKDGAARKIPMTADTGYFSEEAVKGVEEAGFDPYMATKRDKHNQPQPTASSVAETPPTPASQALPTVVAAVMANVVGASEAAESKGSPAEAEGSKDSAAKARTSATTKERMAAKVRTEAGQRLYSRRKVIVEPVFGQIKGARGFRHFSVRNLEKMNGEWQLVCLTHNLLKIWRYRCAPGKN
jgi:transposase